MIESDGRVRIALVGTGAIGKRHVGFLRSRPVFDLVAAADPALGASAYCQDQRIPHFADYRQMLEAERPDGVVIATPNALHEEVALACIEAGIPAMVEKPVADTLESAMRIARAAGRAGVAILVGHHRRHNPLMRAARDFLAGNGIGRLVTVAALDLRRKPDGYFQEGPWRAQPGGGPMLINAIHDIDCMRYLCGEISSVFAWTSNRIRGFPVEDTAAVSLQFADGALGTLAVSDAVEAPWAWEISAGEELEYPRHLEDCYHIGGTEGSLAIPSLTHWRNENGGGRFDPFIRKQLFYVPADPWVEELLHFRRVILGQEKPLITAEDGARTLAAVIAIARSAETGGPVAVAGLMP